MSVLSRGSRVQYVLLWDAPPLSNGQHQEYYNLFEAGMPINLHLPRPLGGGASQVQHSLTRFAVSPSNIFKTCDGSGGYHNISRKVRSLLEGHPKKEILFFQLWSFQIIQVICDTPQKLSSCCQRFFKWVAKRHHQVFDSP